MNFKSKLPSWVIDKKECGNMNNPEIGLPGVLTNENHKIGDFVKGLCDCVKKERRLIFVDERMLCAYIPWIRDHTHMMAAFRHWEYNLKSFFEFFLDYQRKDGQFLELIKQMDDGHWTFVNEDCRILFNDDNVASTRLEIEADVEYLMVLCADMIYKTEGDKKYVKKILPNLEKAIDYMTSSPKRWNGERGLVMRAFTIDTWDFINDKNAGTDRRIHNGEKMSIMHGDNSGVYAAMLVLAKFNDICDNVENAHKWRLKAKNLKENMIKYLWNGKFFIHQLHLNHDGVDSNENQRLSLSNVYDINRGVTDFEQSCLIIEEYQDRRKSSESFSEWFSIDPPYERFYNFDSGKYINGAISPFTAGELSKAAFNHGYEEYGYDIIKRFSQMFERDKNIFFLYDRKTAQAEANGMGPSGWGAAALLNAVDEGLAGITDENYKYNEINFAPRWAVTEYTRIRYFTGYEVNNTVVDVDLQYSEEGILIAIKSPAEKINCHILLPSGKNVSKVTIDGFVVDHKLMTVRNSVYVDFCLIADGNPHRKHIIEIF